MPDEFELPDGSCSVSDIQVYHSIFSISQRNLKNYQTILLFMVISVGSR